MSVAKQIGFPIMIKATAGGGGRGMRLANVSRPCLWPGLGSGGRRGRRGTRATRHSMLRRRCRPAPAAGAAARVPDLPDRSPQNAPPPPLAAPAAAPPPRRRRASSWGCSSRRSRRRRPPLATAPSTWSATSRTRATSSSRWVAGRVGAWQGRGQGRLGLLLGPAGAGPAAHCRPGQPRARGPADPRPTPAPAARCRPRRLAGAGGQARQRGAPGRARLLHPAPQPEAAGGGALARAHPRGAPPPPRRRHCRAHARVGGRLRRCAPAPAPRLHRPAAAGCRLAALPTLLTLTPTLPALLLRPPPAPDRDRRRCARPWATPRSAPPRASATSAWAPSSSCGSRRASTSWRCGRAALLC